MIKKFALLTFLSLVSSLSSAQQAYVCLANSSTGFSYNSNTRSWDRTNFKTGDEKKLLKKFSGGWEWSSFGEASTQKCGEINSYGYLNCDILFGTLRFNKNTLRYIETYTVGYLDGDKGGDTPSITIGKCSAL